MYLSEDLCKIVSVLNEGPCESCDSEESMSSNENENHIQDSGASSKQRNCERNPSDQTRKKGGTSRIESPRSLAAAFACAVTIPAPQGLGWVARNGPESLFSALGKILPQVIQPDSGRRLKGKISSAQFNKVLQSSCGFICGRTRKRGLTRSAGNWLFCNRRWLEPSNRADRQILDQNYEVLCNIYPLFLSARSSFFDVLTEITEVWSSYIFETKNGSGIICTSLAAHGSKTFSPSSTNPQRLIRKGSFCSHVSESEQSPYSQRWEVSETEQKGTRERFFEEKDSAPNGWIGYVDGQVGNSVGDCIKHDCAANSRRSFDVPSQNMWSQTLGPAESNEAQSFPNAEIYACGNRTTIGIPIKKELCDGNEQSYVRSGLDWLSEASHLIATQRIDVQELLHPRSHARCDDSEYVPLKSQAREDMSIDLVCESNISGPVLKACADTAFRLPPIACIVGGDSAFSQARDGLLELKLGTGFLHSCSSAFQRRDDRRVLCL